MTQQSATFAHKVAIPLALAVVVVSAAVVGSWTPLLSRATLVLAFIAPMALTVAGLLVTRRALRDVERQSTARRGGGF